MWCSVVRQHAVFYIKLYVSSPRRHRFIINTIHMFVNSPDKYTKYNIQITARQIM